MQLVTASAFILLLSAGVDCARLRANSSEEPSSEENIAKIQEKWSKMDDFLEVMFTIACKWQNGKDVNGLASHKLKEGDLKGDEVQDFKKATQADNINKLKRSCGNIVAKGEKNCRQSCADGYGEVMEKRSKCDGECVSNYDNFEKRCHQQADNLKQVYKMKLDQAASRKRCHEGFCNEFPSVWIKDKDKMGAEVDKQCGKWCKPELVKKRCESKWLLEVDFIRDDVTSSCHADGKAADCMNDASTTAGEEQDSCAKKGKGECGKQLEKCNTDGKVDNNFKEAGDFCKSRNKMCEGQVTEKCLKDHKDALESGRKKCEGDDSDELKACKKKKLDEKKKETVDKCASDNEPKCTKDCKGKCQTDKMNECLGHLESAVDPGEEFCQNFWGLLHESSEVDPKTGNPVVLLSANSSQRV